MKKELSPAIELYRNALIAAGVNFFTADMFLTYHLKNPQIWKAFEARTLECIAQGQRKGAKAIMEDVRWAEKVGSVKNEFISYYARTFAIKHPAHRDYFVFKEVKGLKERAA